MKKKKIVLLSGWEKCEIDLLNIIYKMFHRRILEDWRNAATTVQKDEPFYANELFVRSNQISSGFLCKKRQRNGPIRRNSSEEDSNGLIVNRNTKEEGKEVECIKRRKK